jgi:hypothetical protein
MSDAVILEDEDPREFHSPFDLALDWAALEAFKWLVVGHVLFAILLGLLVLADANATLGVSVSPFWLTPFFTLPLVWAGRGHMLVPKVAALLVGFTVAHWLAMQSISLVNAIEHPMLPGLIAGAVGAGLSLLFVLLGGLARHGAPTAIFAVFGAALLAGVGSLVVYLYMTTGSGGESGAAQWIQLMKIYTPWQIAFAYVLAKVLRADNGA